MALNLCDRPVDNGDMHCGHINDGLPCCQCGYMRQIPSAKDVRIAALEVALKQLANEASGFKSMADPFTHGHTNMAVLGLRIDEARAALAQTAPREDVKP